MTDRVVVIGAGGMGREILDVVEAMHAGGHHIEVAGVADDNPNAAALDRLGARGYRYLGTTSDVLGEEERGRYTIGVGSPRARRAIADRFDAAGWEPATVIHPQSTIGSGGRVEPGVVLCAGVRVTTNVVLERHVLLNLNVTVGHEAQIGAYSVANPGVHISGDVTIRPGVLIGTGAAILQGLEIGEDATVGANACVTRNVDAGITVVGVPARPVGAR